MFDIDQDITVLEVLRAASAYRAAEQDGTPRLWRGKGLQDLATALDEALEKFVAEYGDDIL